MMLPDRLVSSSGVTWVRIVIVHYNSGDHLPRTLAALAAQTDACFEAVIIDNGSTDGVLERITLPDHRFSVIRAERNLGFAAGCNLGAADAATPFLAMLNPDAMPKPDWLAQARRAAATYPTTAMFSSTQLMAEDENLLDGGGDTYSIFGLPWRGGFGQTASLIHADYPCFAPCAAAGFYRRDAFEEVGGFAEDFFCYMEDVDLGFRLRLAGYDCRHLAFAKVSHVGSAITGRYSPFTLYHSSRNGIFLMGRCLPWPLLCLSLPLFLMGQVYLSWRNRNLGTLAPRWHGILDGLRRLPSILRDQRPEIQRLRRLGIWQTARLLVWNPRLLSRRAIVRLDDPTTFSQ